MTDENSNNTPNDQTDGGRRRFIKNTGMVAGGVVGGSFLGGLLTKQFSTQDESHTKNIQEKSHDEARQFFTRLEDFRVLESATECIYPKDKNGPGAIELGVPFFIDKQLAGKWGINGRDYRQAPFLAFKDVENMKGKETEEQPTNQVYTGKTPETELQRTQSRLTRGEIFIDGLRKMNEISQKQHKLTFDKLEEKQQIKILQDFEGGKVNMTSVASENFFVLLRQTTIEGAFADPLYGGNRNMAGWDMKEFPGPRPSYADMIEKDEFVKMKPISLKDYQGH